MERAVVIKINFKGKVIDTYVLAKPVAMIGRDSAADIFLDNPGVSRQHATIEVGASSLFLRDLASANGTFVNGERTHHSELKDGDVVRIGRFDLEVSVPHVVQTQGRHDGRMCPPAGATLEAPLPRSLDQVDEAKRRRP